MAKCLLSGISIATGISSVVTFSTFIGLPVSIPLGAASLNGATASGIISMLTNKYQKKLMKVIKLTDIITLALAVFETSVSKALKNGKIDEEEFNSLQMFHLKMMNELTDIDHNKWKQKTETNSKKPTGRDKRNKEKPRNKSLMICSLCYFACYFKMEKICYQPNHLGKVRKPSRRCENLARKQPKVVKQWLSKQAF